MDHRPATDGYIPIRGQRWRVRHGDPGRALLGECDFSKRVITIRKGLTLAEEMAVLIHEVDHAANPDKCEEAVEGTELAIMCGLRLWGFVPTDD